MRQPVYTSQKIKSLETSWAHQNKGSTWPLMVSAAVSFVEHFSPIIDEQKILIIAGNGNNGGDGYYIAKLLKDAGLMVKVYAPLGLPRQELDAHRAFNSYAESKGVVLSSMPKTGFTIIIDALFGIGLSRSLSAELIQLIEHINSLELPILSVDIPSGLNANYGSTYGAVFNATATLSFIGLKPGLLTNLGPSVVGELTLDTLGITVEADWFSITETSALPHRQGNHHKSMSGNVRVMGGRLNMAGAAIIAGHAALNAGAGRTFVHCDPTAFPSVIAVAPELMTAGEFHNSDHHRSTAYIVGPGLGRDQAAHSIVQTLLSMPHSAGVLDADALHLIHPAELKGAKWVLTPHEGEAAHLLGISSQQVQGDRVTAALKLSEQYSSVVVLKGAGSIVADQGKLVFCHQGSPAMATPGMGDCLAGIIGSLMAQGMSGVDAAITGVNWHANIGSRLAKTQRVVMASHIVKALCERID